jgi:signal peptidase I
LSAIRRFIFGENPRRTAVRVIVLAAISGVTLKWVLIPIRTDGSSMLPTYAPNRLHFVNRLSYGANGPARGDIVAIQLAGPNVVYIKRVVGLPGERVAVSGGQVRINGAPLPEPYVVHRRSWELEEVTLEPREYFVIGDNRGVSDYGRTPADKILGRVVF